MSRAYFAPRTRRTPRVFRRAEARRGAADGPSTLAGMTRAFRSLGRDSALTSDHCDDLGRRRASAQSFFVDRALHLLETDVEEQFEIGWVECARGAERVEGAGEAAFVWRTNAR